MKLAFLIDPPESLHIKKDTSVALMLEAQSRGDAVYVLTRGGVSLSAGKVFITASAARIDEKAAQPFELSPAERRPAEYFDVIFIRTDPPFNTAYLQDTWLLSHTRGKPLVLNAPHGLRNMNEKIWAAQFPEFTPRTLITSRKEEFMAFLHEHGRVVIKPTDGFGGSAVFMLSAEDMNAAVACETLLQMSGYVVAQQYLPAAAEGDKRLLLLRGEILGAVLRLHNGEDHRNNFAAGGSAQEATITDEDRKICETLKPHLDQNGIFLAGIDVIGGKLIEVNVTSPTCLREMQNYYNENLAGKIIDAAHQEAGAAKTSQNYAGN